LLVGVVATLVVLGVLAGTGAWVLVHTSAVNGHLVDRSSPALTAAARLETSLTDQESGIRGYGLTGDPRFLESYTAGLAGQRAQVGRLIVLLRGDHDALEDFALVLERTEQWQARVARPVAAAPPGGVPASTRERIADKGVFDAVRAATGQQQDRLQRQRDRARADLDDVRSLRTWVFSAIAMVILVVAGLVFTGLRRGVTTPVARLVADADAVARGDFRHEITPTGPADLRALADAMESMRDRLARELDFSDDARRRLDDQASELRRSNADLEQFAYVASHDLQEPLRKVASFCGLLHKRYRGRLDERADQYLGFAVDGAVRMQTQINHLLAFSRVGRDAVPAVPVDLEEVYATVVGDLAIAIEETGADVAHEPLPTVSGDRTQLSVVLQNLLANAIKFRKPDRAVRVRMRTERDGDVWRISVTDNGIGIEPAYAERVFVIFQRLHTREAYPGHGMGLAMCKKIVEYHGGTIGIDPEYTEGTRIVFTLPVAE
jgi:signal transduction histidine kinase